VRVYRFDLCPFENPSPQSSRLAAKGEAGRDAGILSELLYEKRVVARYTRIELHGDHRHELLNIPSSECDQGNRNFVRFRLARTE
jgi:hypothetical protein